MTQLSQQDKATELKSESTLKPKKYSVYILFVLTLVYVFNFVDRQILSILAPFIQEDLGISDAQMGFLYGTAFAVFYAIFGIPLGRLADVWVRRKLISLGLGLWSAMTALSGLASNFLGLGILRIGVGVGEASASPASYSMLIDSFPKAIRATALSIYSSGVFIGSGVALFVGGYVVEKWNNAYPLVEGLRESPFALEGWQVAFFMVGIPGLLLALWTWTLREPIRGINDGAIAENHPHPFKEFAKELGSIIPPFTFFTLAQQKNAKKELLINFVMLAVTSLICWQLVNVLGKPHFAQWLALGIGVYSTATWAQLLRLRQPDTFTLIFKSPSVMLGLIGFSCIAFVTYGVGFWYVKYSLVSFDVKADEFGLIAGMGVAIGGFIGVNLGGVISDALKSRTIKARLLMGFLTAALSFPVIQWMLSLSDVKDAYWAIFIFYIVSTLYIGSAPTFINEMVLPQMRSVGSAVYLLILSLIGLGLGPYAIGVVSDKLRRSGVGNNLQVSMDKLSYMLVAASVLLVLAMIFVKRDDQRCQDMLKLSNRDAN